MFLVHWSLLSIDSVAGKDNMVSIQVFANISNISLYHDTFVLSKLVWYKTCSLKNNILENLKKINN